MIKKRLVRLLDDSKKYIVQNVFWQWLGLLFQIAAIGAAGLLLEHLAEGTLSSEILLLSAGTAVCSAAVRFFVRNSRQRQLSWQARMSSGSSGRRSMRSW